MEWNEELKLLAKKIEEAERILILTHLKPDGDAVGSVLAVKHALEGRGKDVSVYADELPELYSWIDEAESFIPVEEFSTEEKFDLCFALDASNAERGIISDVAGSTFIVNIDHHKDNSHFGDLNFVDPDAAAAGAIVYRILRSLGFKITSEIASALYIALMTDTGRFSFSNTDAETFRIAAALIEAGADPQHLTDNIYKNFSFRRAELFGKVVNTLESHHDGAILSVELPYELVESKSIGQHETDGIIDFLQGVKGQEASLFFKQFYPDKVRVSLRSKGRINVQEVASRHNGGGHVFASGCTYEGGLASAKKDIIAACVEQLDKSR